jgi:hypothetical protein
VKGLGNARGAVSIFQCMVLMALLLLAGLLTDAARILVAGKRVDSALKTSLRSVMAGYDRNLTGEFGIFGLDVTSDMQGAREEFLGYLRSNMDSGDAAFTFVKYDIDLQETELKDYGGLLDDVVFRRQLMEYMKYRAPMAVTEGIVEKLQSSGVFKMLDFSKSETQVREKRKELKTKIKQANQTLQTADELRKDSISGLLQLKETLLQAVRSLEDINIPLEEYTKTGNASREIARQSGFEPCTVEFGGLLDSVRGLEGIIHSNREQLEITLEKAVPLQEEINRLKSRKQELDAEISHLEKEAKAGREAPGLADRQKEASSVGNRIAAGAMELGEVLGAYSYMAVGGIAAEDPPDTHLYPRDDKARSNVDLFLQAVQSKLKEHLRDIPAEWLIDGQEQENAEKRDNEAYQQMELKAGNDAGLEEEAEQKNSNVLSFLQRIRDMADLLQNSAEKGMERIYIMQYIMDKYTYLTSETERGHYFEKGEVEFILWGDSHQLANIVRTSGSVWLLRFSIDTVDSFATSKLPHPIARLLASLGEGFLQSCRDMLQLYDGKDISLCPSLKNSIMVSYGDHLQVFLLLQSPKEQLDRMRQLMQVDLLQTDPEFRLDHHKTMLYGSVKVRIQLWFLPLFRLHWLDHERFDGGKYILVREFHTHY